MRKIGLHLRITDTLNNLVDKAVRLDLPFFQCFLTNKKTGKISISSDRDICTFISRCRIYFSNLYMHASYLINLASFDCCYHPILVKELEWAKYLEFTHIVIHPGSVRNIYDKEKGIDAVARIMNSVLKREYEVIFLLENTACSDCVIGNIFDDFHMLLTKLDKPDRIGFCIDTVHAYMAGYDIISQQGYEKFINLLERTIGLNRIKLIHLNDTRELCGSYRDIHCCVGDSKAVLGKTVLSRFIHEKKFVSIPLLTELPVIAEEDEQHILDNINDMMVKK